MHGEHAERFPMPPERRPVLPEPDSAPQQRAPLASRTALGVRVHAPAAGPRARADPAASRSARASLRALLMPSPSYRGQPVLEQRGSGVPGLLGVELGRAHRPVLDGGDERLAVLGRRDEAVGVGAPRRSGRSRTGSRRPTLRTRSSRPAPERCSSPCAAAPARAAVRPGRAARRGPRTRRRARRRPRTAPACRRRCRAPGARQRAASSSTARAPTLVQPGHAGRERADPRHDQPVRLDRRPGIGRDGDVGADPLERALGRAQVARPVVEHDDGLHGVRADGVLRARPSSTGCRTRAGPARRPRAAPGPPPCTAPR